MDSPQDFITVAYMNIRGQTGLDITKQVQIEHFLKFYSVDILHCQEINISSTTLTTSYLTMLAISMVPAALCQVASK